MWYLSCSGPQFNREKNITKIITKIITNVQFDFFIVTFWCEVFLWWFSWWLLWCFLMLLNRGPVLCACTLTVDCFRLIANCINCGRFRDYLSSSRSRSGRPAGGSFFEAERTWPARPFPLTLPSFPCRHASLPWAVYISRSVDEVLLLFLLPRWLSSLKMGSRGEREEREREREREQSRWGRKWREWLEYHGVCGGRQRHGRHPPRPPSECQAWLFVLISSWPSVKGFPISATVLRNSGWKADFRWDR